MRSSAGPPAARTLAGTLALGSGATTRRDYAPVRRGSPSSSEYHPAVPEFLSPAWVAELDTALRSSALRAGEQDPALVYQLEAHDDDGVVRTHHITIGPDGARALDGSASEPDLVLVTDAETALALHRNDCNAQAAIASGRLRIRGDLEAFSRHASTIASLGDLFATLRSSTTATAPSAGEDDR